MSSEELATVATSPDYTPEAQEFARKLLFERDPELLPVPNPQQTPETAPEQPEFNNADARLINGAMWAHGLFGGVVGFSALSLQSHEGWDSPALPLVACAALSIAVSVGLWARQSWALVPIALLGALSALSAFVVHLNTRFTLLAVGLAAVEAWVAWQVNRILRY